MTPAAKLTIVEIRGSFWIVDGDDEVDGPYLHYHEAARVVDEWVEIERQEAEDD